MYGLYIDAYTAFLALISIFLVANASAPRKKTAYRHVRGYNPRTLVIIPCKGFDIALADNLKAAKRQSYRNYDVIAVVATRSDSALNAIHETGTKFMISNSKCKRCSGKVRSLGSALSRCRDYDAYVILDSDVLVGRDWLGLLVAPLSDKSIGISTAFPVFAPIGKGLWQRIKHAWGFVGQGLMENRMTRFGWGGSLAFRNDLMSKGDFRYFSESVSDDIALTKIAKRNLLGIAYVPEANPIVISDDDYGKFTEWSNRQTAFSISGSRKVLYAGLAYYSLSILLMVSSIALGILVNSLFLVLLLPFVIGAIRLYLKSGKYAYMLWIYPLINFVYLYNLISASFIKTVEWRGRKYDMRGI